MPKYRNALTYVESRDDVDSNRLGVFGISYSGGHVLILAAIDSRVKAAVSVVPVVDGHANMKRVHVGDPVLRLSELYPQGSQGSQQG